MYEVALDDDEENCLALPPKFCIFPDVKVEDFRLEQMMGNVKARWDRQGNRDFDLKGNEVTEEDPEEGKKTMEEMVKENSRREPFNPKERTLDF